VCIGPAPPTALTRKGPLRPEGSDALTPRVIVRFRRDLAVYGRDGERRVLTAVTAVGEHTESSPPGRSRARFSRRAAIFFHLSSQLDLLRDAERVVDLDAEVADCAFELRMTASYYASRFSLKIKGRLRTVRC
jgi:hypothetical protein